MPVTTGLSCTLQVLSLPSNQTCDNFRSAGLIHVSWPRRALIHTKQYGLLLLPLGRRSRGCMIGERYLANRQIWDPPTPTHCFLCCLIKPNSSASRTAGESVQDSALLLPEHCSIHVGTEWHGRLIRTSISYFKVLFSNLDSESQQCDWLWVYHGDWWNNRTECCRFLNWLTVIWLVKILPIFYGTRRYIAIYMKGVCWSVSWCMWLATLRSVTSWFNFNITCLELIGW